MLAVGHASDSFVECGAAVAAVDEDWLAPRAAERVEDCVYQRCERVALRVVRGVVDAVGLRRGGVAKLLQGKVYHVM